jgi:hypothetical protein
VRRLGGLWEMASILRGCEYGAGEHPLLKRRLSTCCCELQSIWIRDIAIVKCTYDLYVLQIQLLIQIQSIVTVKSWQSENGYSLLLESDASVNTKKFNTTLSLCLQQCCLAYAHCLYFRTRAMFRRLFLFQSWNKMYDGEWTISYSVGPIKL